jgi:hypothetical protein
MGPVDMSAFKLGDPIGVHGDVFRNYRYPDTYKPMPRVAPVPYLTGALATRIAARNPLSSGLIDSPVSMGIQGLMLGSAISRGDEEHSRNVANLLLAARAAALAESVHMGVLEANRSLAAAAAASMRSAPILNMFGPRNAVNYKAALAALRTSLLKAPARNLGALMAVGIARSILTNPSRQEE